MRTHNADWVTPVPVRSSAPWHNYSPSISFVTPGDLTVTYSSRIGWHMKMGNVAFVGGELETSSFTHTTAGGALRVTLPYTCDDEAPFPGANLAGSLMFSGWTKAGCTQAGVSLAAGYKFFNVWTWGSGQPMASITAADLPTGSALRLNWQLWYSWKAAA